MAQLASAVFELYFLTPGESLYFHGLPHGSSCGLASIMTRLSLVSGVRRRPTAPSKHSDVAAQPVGLACLHTEPHHGVAARRHEPGRVLAPHR